MIADWEFYTDKYRGIAITDEFEYARLSIRADAELDFYTLGRASRNTNLEAVKLAACAVAEQVQVWEKAMASASSTGAELQSETVGSYSRTFRSSDDIRAEAKRSIREAVEKYLAHTGLLYRGVSSCMHRTL